MGRKELIVQTLKLRFFEIIDKYVFICHHSKTQGFFIADSSSRIREILRSVPLPKVNKSKKSVKLNSKLVYLLQFDLYSDICPRLHKSPQL